MLELISFYKFAAHFGNKKIMYAIVEIAGQQFKVEKDQQIFVHRLDSKEGEKVTFDNVLLTYWRWYTNGVGCGSAIIWSLERMPLSSMGF